MEVFAPNWDHAEKVDVHKSYWNPKRKLGVNMHFSRLLALNLKKNADISIFLKKEGNNISSSISLEFAFTYTYIYKDLETTLQMVTYKTLLRRF